MADTDCFACVHSSPPPTRFDYALLNGSPWICLVGVQPGHHGFHWYAGDAALAGQEVGRQVIQSGRQSESISLH